MFPDGHSANARIPPDNLAISFGVDRGLLRCGLQSVEPLAPPRGADIGIACGARGVPGAANLDLADGRTKPNPRSKSRNGFSAQARANESVELIWQCMLCAMLEGWDVVAPPSCRGRRRYLPRLMPCLSPVAPFNCNVSPSHAQHPHRGFTLRATHWQAWRPATLDLFSRLLS